MRSVKAYTVTAEALASEVADIRSGDAGYTEDEQIIALEVVVEIASKLAAEFEYDNPAGFDRQRFMTDAGVNIN